MKFLGIDYGQKNIGLAVSDKRGLLAFPFSIVLNDSLESVIGNLKKVISEENIQAVVIGFSLNLEGQKNSIQKKIEILAAKLEQEGIKVFFQDERFTSLESQWDFSKKSRRSFKKNREEKKEKNLDDKAACLILKTFLDRKNFL